MPISDNHLLLLAATAYGGAMSLTFWRVSRGHEPARQINYLLILGGWLVQSVGLWMRGLDAGGCPIRNPFEVLSFVSWSVVLVYLATGKVFRLTFFGTGCASLAALLSLTAFLLPGTEMTRSSSRLGHEPWIETHAAIAFFSYGIFGLLAVLSALYLLQNSALKHKRCSRWFSLLPSIVEMEFLLGRLLLTATAVFSVAMLIGGVHWIQHPEQLGSIKLASANLLWLGWIGMAALRLAGRLYGARLAAAGISLFLFALLILWPIEVARPQPAAARPAPSSVSSLPHYVR